MTKSNRLRHTSPLYIAWVSMLSRCNNVKDKQYSIYGGLGVMVCERWMNYKNFCSDVGERPEGMTLDRIDPDGNYEPSNCRWADGTIQSSNKRKKTKTGIPGVTYNKGYYVARVRVNGSEKIIRYRKTLEEAVKDRDLLWTQYGRGATAPLSFAG